MGQVDKGPHSGEAQELRSEFLSLPGLLTQHWRYRLDLPESVTVKEGLCVLVPCQFFYPSTFLEPLYMFWFQKGVDMNDDLLVATNKPQQKLQERARGRFFLPRDPQPNNCSLTIIDVNRWDSGMYFLQMEKRSRIYSFQNQMFSLKVTGMVGAQGKAPGYGVPK